MTKDIEFPFSFDMPSGESFSAVTKWVDEQIVDVFRVPAEALQSDYYLRHSLAQGLRDRVTQPSTPPDIGDCLCKYNARSPYLRCAVNPSGPCDGCKSFELITERDRI